jgi:hypothetical protein
MRMPADFAGGQVGAAYCSTCGDETGQLKPYNQVLQLNAEYLVRQQGLDRSAAREMARVMLASMPAWKHHG